MNPTNPDTPQTDEPSCRYPDPGGFADYFRFRSACAPRGPIEAGRVRDAWLRHKQDQKNARVRAATATARPPRPAAVPKPTPAPAPAPAPTPASARTYAPGRGSATLRVEAFNARAVGNAGGIVLTYASQHGKTLGQLYEDPAPVNPQFIPAAEPRSRTA